MTKIKLVAMDIDDTLLNDEKIITEANRLAIQEAIRNGVKVVLSSGRTHLGMAEYLDKLGLEGSNQYIITNGGGLVETVDNQIIFKRTLSNSTYRQIDEFVKANQLHYNAVDLEQKTYTCGTDFIDRSTIIQAFENDQGLIIKEPDQLPNDFEIIKAVINENGDKLDAITPLVEETFGNDCYVIRTGSGFLEIMPQNTDKGSALEFLADYLQIDLSETMAIGDGANDGPMLEKAGVAVAMANADTEIKKMADFVTTDNNQNGVAKAFNDYVLN